LGRQCHPHEQHYHHYDYYYYFYRELKVKTGDCKGLAACPTHIACFSRPKTSYFLVAKAQVLCKNGDRNRKKKKILKKEAGMRAPPFQANKLLRFIVQQSADAKRYRFRYPQGSCKRYNYEYEYLFFRSFALQLSWLRASASAADDDYDELVVMHTHPHPHTHLQAHPNPFLIILRFGH